MNIKEMAVDVDTGDANRRQMEGPADHGKGLVCCPDMTGLFFEIQPSE